jgi:hypothetical protein
LRRRLPLSYFALDEDSNAFEDHRSYETMSTARYSQEPRPAGGAHFRSCCVAMREHHIIQIEQRRKMAFGLSHNGFSAGGFSVGEKREMPTTTPRWALPSKWEA